MFIDESHQTWVTKKPRTTVITEQKTSTIENHFSAPQTAVRNSSGAIAWWAIFLIVLFAAAAVIFFIVVIRKNRYKLHPKNDDPIQAMLDSALSWNPLYGIEAKSNSLLASNGEVKLQSKNHEDPIQALLDSALDSVLSWNPLYGTEANFNSLDSGVKLQSKDPIQAMLDSDAALIRNPLYRMKPRYDPLITSIQSDQEPLNYPLVNQYQTIPESSVSEDMKINEEEHIPLERHELRLLQHESKTLLSQQETYFDPRPASACAQYEIRAAASMNGTSTTHDMLDSRNSQWRSLAEVHVNYFRFLVCMVRAPNSRRIRRWLRSPEKSGTFAIRPSSSGQQTHLAISCMFGELHQEHITIFPHECKIRDKSFSSLADIISYYRMHDDLKAGAVLTWMTSYGDEYIDIAAENICHEVLKQDDKFDQFANAVIDAAARNCSVANNHVDLKWCKKIWYGDNNDETSVA